MFSFSSGLLIINVLFSVVIYEHLQNIGAITELEFRQIMEVNRNVEVIGITYKENISRELTLLGPAGTLPPPSLSLHVYKMINGLVLRFPRAQAASF